MRRNYQDLYTSLCGLVPDAYRWSRLEFKKMCNKSARYDELKVWAKERNLGFVVKKMERLDKRTFVKGDGSIKKHND